MSSDDKMTFSNPLGDGDEEPAHEHHHEGHTFREEKAKKEREQLRNVCNYQWVPNQPAADPVAVPARK